MSVGARELDSFLDALATTVDARLAGADRVLATDYPGDPGTRQPVHTVYVPADLADESTPAQWGTEARTLLDATAPGTVDDEVRARVDEKLSEHPRGPAIDFEDGYGIALMTKRTLPRGLPAHS